MTTTTPKDTARQLAWNMVERLIKEQPNMIQFEHPSSRGTEAAKFIADLHKGLTAYYEELQKPS